MGISADEFRTLLARRDAVNVSAAYPVREGWEGGALTIFVPGRYMNPLNVSAMGVWKHRRWAKTWRERTAAALLPHHRKQVQRQREVPNGTEITVYFSPGPWPWVEDAPKRITFQLYGWNPLDSDGRSAACKPMRDAMKDMRVIDDDRDKSGHAFDYPPVIVGRKKDSPRGVAIRVLKA